MKVLLHLGKSDRVHPNFCTQDSHKSKTGVSVAHKRTFVHQKFVYKKLYFRLVIFTGYYLSVIPAHVIIRHKHEAICSICNLTFPS